MLTFGVKTIQIDGMEILVLYVQKMDDFGNLNK